MIERIFVGWDRPTLPLFVGLLQERYGRGGIWDMGAILVALPGRQAGRRLRRLIHDAAMESGVGRVAPPQVVTPGELMERLYAPRTPIAGPLETHCAWARAVGQVGAGAAGVSAREARRARETVLAERLTPADVARQCWEAGNERRWEALAGLEAAYLAALADAGLADRDGARMAALAAGPLSCRRDIFLVGVQDLNGLERAMLRALTTSVIAVIPAPDEEQIHFDDTGTLDAAYWSGADIPIPEEVLQFVDGPAEEADALIAHIAALGDGAFAREQITVGVGDEAGADGLARRLAVLGLPVLSPFGRPLSRVRPGALLRDVRDFLRAPSTCSFASLVRHPDMEVWLTAQASEGLLTHLDIYRAECLPRTFPDAEDLPAARLSPCPSGARTARAAVLDAHAAAEGLLAPLRGPARPLPDWAEPVAALLRAVYAGATLDEGTPAGRRFGRGLSGLAQILRALSDLPVALAPALSGAEALDFVLAQAEAVRLPPDADESGAEMRGWLELALDDAPVLLLTGLHGGRVPADTGDDPLLPDALRRRLGLADDRRRRARDGLLLRQMVESRQSQGRSVRLIVSRRGADGDPRMPSRLLFACDGETAARRALLFAAHGESAPAARPLFTPGPARALSPPPPVTESPLTELGVSGFRAYLACPYRFYLRHVLKLTGQDDAPEEMDTRLFGTLVHDCLAAFARSDEALSANVSQVRAFLKRELDRQSERRFGKSAPRAVQMQVRQAARRLETFAAWQAQSTADGWHVQSDLSERRLTASLDVDGVPFGIHGDLDRVDRHRETGQYRVWDYKTGDAGRGPETQHRRKSPGTAAGRCWADLQLPLYRLLLVQNGLELPPDGAGYVLLCADLNSVSEGVAAWTEEDHEDALECARAVVRDIRRGLFWPPADPPPFPPSRRGPGHTDAFGGLCLDSCPDRRAWFAPLGGTA